MNLRHRIMLLLTMVILAVSTNFAFAADSATITPEIASRNCTYSHGYWKNHESAWPVTSLTLGSVSYNQAQLLSILRESTHGNGLVSMSRQLIAAKLNIANGADPSAVAATIAAADAQIGSLVVPPVGSGFLDTSSTSSKNATLDNYNNGIIGPGHCESLPVAPETFSRVKVLFK